MAWQARLASVFNHCLCVGRVQAFAWNEQAAVSLSRWLQAPGLEHVRRVQGRLSLCLHHANRENRAHRSASRVLHYGNKCRARSGILKNIYV